MGGFVEQYQVALDPTVLLAYNLPVSRVIEAIRRSNNDVGGRVIELVGTEYMERGRGYIASLDDLRAVTVGSGPGGTPILLRDVANISRGPDMRRGLAEFNGTGEAVGGIVVMRYGENALAVIDRIKARIDEVRDSLHAHLGVYPRHQPRPGAPYCETNDRAKQQQLCGESSPSNGITSFVIGNGYEHQYHRQYNDVVGSRLDFQYLSHRPGDPMISDDFPQYHGVGGC